MLSLALDCSTNQPTSHLASASPIAHRQREQDGALFSSFLMLSQIIRCMRPKVTFFFFGSAVDQSKAKKNYLALAPPPITTGPTISTTPARANPNQTKTRESKTGCRPFVFVLFCLVLFFVPLIFAFWDYPPRAPRASRLGICCVHVVLPHRKNYTFVRRSWREETRKQQGTDNLIIESYIPTGKPIPFPRNRKPTSPTTRRCPVHGARSDNSILQQLSLPKDSSLN